MEINLIVNLVTAVLLLVALFYGMRLSRHIQTFLKSRAELGELFRTFDRTIAEAREHMKGLRKAADESEEKLRASVDRATVLANDLSDVADRAEKVFAVIERSRAEKKPLTPSAESKVTFKEEDDADAAPLTDAQRAKKQAVLEKMLEKVANARKESDAKPEKKSDSVKKSATGKKLSKVV